MALSSIFSSRESSAESKSDERRSRDYEGVAESVVKGNLPIRALRSNSETDSFVKSFLIIFNFTYYIIYFSLRSKWITIAIYSLTTLCES